MLITCPKLITFWTDVSIMLSTLVGRDMLVSEKELALGALLGVGNPLKFLTSIILGCACLCIAQVWIQNKSKYV